MILLTNLSQSEGDSFTMWRNGSVRSELRKESYERDHATGSHYAGPRIAGQRARCSVRRLAYAVDSHGLPQHEQLQRSDGGQVRLRVGARRSGLPPGFATEWRPPVTLQLPLPGCLSNTYYLAKISPFARLHLPF